jgi:O-antigen/teichoic acid export membrane protein
VYAIRQLAGQTAVYGLGTIVPRFLNYALLTPFYTRVFRLGEYGVVTELYAYIIVLLVVLTYGMETGFFRFTEKEKDKKKVFSTAIFALFVTSVLFVLIVGLLNREIADILDYSENREYIILFSLIVAIDAFTAIPFAKLRWENRSLRFSFIKLVNTGVIIILVFFFLYFAPKIIEESNGDWIERIYSPEIGVGYVFIANLVGSMITLFLLIPEIVKIRLNFDVRLFRRMFKYSFPLLIAGLAGSINEALDKIILKHLLRDPETAMDQLGIYGANFKIAVIMTLFIQMFRYAAEPFFFSKASEKNAKDLYANVMKYFMIFCLIIFLAVTMYIEIIKYLIGSEFRVETGLDIVPIVLIAYIFYGVFVNLSIWYKLNDKTKYGAIIVVIGALVTIIVNVGFVPKYGYHASAWAHFFCYLTMIIISYFWGRRFYKINYKMVSIGSYFGLAILLYFISEKINIDSAILKLGINTIVFIFFIVIVVWKENMMELIKGKTGNKDKV